MSLERRAPLRTVGPIAGAVLLSIIAIALHPHLTGHPGTQAALREMGTLSARDRIVHGTLLALLVALLTGCVKYARRRGLARWPVLAGLVAFGVGIGGLLAAGLIDGFLLPQIVARFVTDSATAQAAAVATLAAWGAAVNVFTSFGMTALAIAIGAWSLDLARDPGESRLAGIAGFVSAALTIAVIVRSGSSLEPHALLAMLCAQGVWYIWLAVLVAREQAGLASTGSYLIGKT